METRRFGRTGHRSTVAIRGGAAFSSATQAESDVMMERAIAAGVNHIDVAPSYGEAEARMGPWLARERGRFFLGCKTTERTRQGAAAELRRSLQRLQVERFELYQIHAVTSFADLDAVTQAGGALEAALEAREQGLTRSIGITGHGWQVAAVFLEALRRFDFDSVLFPVNYSQYAHAGYRREAEALLRECQARDVGVMAIKSVAHEPWGEQAHSYTTWYRPLTTLEDIQPAVNFALSQPVTGLCTAGDARLLDLMLEACEHYQPMGAAEQAQLIEAGAAYAPIFG
jgi:aryl-alcohol dehydrogenase-like predicted oxidoreductase